MNEFLCHKKTTWMRKTIASLILAAFFLNTITPAGAQILPLSGTSVGFKPPVLLGLKIHPENPLLFDFIVDQGQAKLSEDELKSETEKLVKYFFAALTIPDKEVWVNLSPYEKDRIIPDVLGATIMGQTMLEQDYTLKQLAASLTNPDTDLGRKFWDDVKRHTPRPDGLGTSSAAEVPLNTFNKVWIVPQKAEVLESHGIAIVGERHLKLMMADDYENNVSRPRKGDDASDLSSQIFRTTILPTMEKEINEGKNFANVRQIYNSVILAAWYKKALKESLLGRVYADKGKVAGVTTDDKDMKQRIYEQYLAAFKKGAYSLIKEEVDPATGDAIPRKYFSGGIVGLGISGSSSLAVRGVSLDALNSAVANSMSASSGLSQFEVAGAETEANVQGLVSASSTVSTNALGSRYTKKELSINLGETKKGTVDSTNQSLRITINGQPFAYGVRVLSDGLYLDYFPQQGLQKKLPFVYTPRPKYAIQSSPWDNTDSAVVNQISSSRYKQGVSVEVSKNDREGYSYTVSAASASSTVAGFKQVPQTPQEIEEAVKDVKNRIAQRIIRESQILYFAIMLEVIPSVLLGSSEVVEGVLGSIPFIIKNNPDYGAGDNRYNKKGPLTVSYLQRALTTTTLDELV